MKTNIGWTGFWGGFSKLDPTLLTLALATWAILTAGSLFYPGDVFHRVETYRPLLDMGIPEYTWASLFALDAFSLLYILLPRQIAVRSIITLASCLLWTFWGAKLIQGSYRLDYISTVGCWFLICGQALGLTGIQWISKS